MAIADQDLGELIERARDVSAESASRHHAFEQLVRRFQDLAFACACARLRDAALAEDAAQDAFLLAWERLGQLREPAAFPGWIRRLVLTQCNRRLRVRRLQLRPEDEASELAGPCDTAADVEASDQATLVRIALAGLAPHDRLVLILFYGSERTHEEIAAWLGIPVTTVARRLAHARRRLRRQALAGLSGGLRAQQTAARNAFVVELSCRLRRAQPNDAAGIARLAGHLRLDRAPTVAVPAWCAYVVEDSRSGRPIAYAAAVQTIFKPIYELQLAIGAGPLKRHAGDVLLAQIVQELVACGAIALQHRTSARHAAVTAFLLSRGFQVIERAEDWVLLERLLRKTVRLAREQLDEFVGRYVSEAPRGCPVTIEIERHGDSLVSTSRDMRDVLLAASDTEFFTRHHYDQGRFERDSSGHVVRLVCSEGRREFVASRA